MSAVPWLCIRRGVVRSAQRVRSVHAAAASVDPKDIEHFSRIADDWWNENGEFAPLHSMNRVRIDFMQQKLEEVHGWDTAVAEALGRAPLPPPLASPDFLRGFSMLDIGCGGGILAESATRLGACVTGVDASAENIRVAKVHAARDPSLCMRDDAAADAPASLAYLPTSAETLRAEGRTFDIVAAMEVVEHVNKPADFLRCLADLLKPGGHLFMSTMSRTVFSYILTIFLAEDMLRVVTPGTHRHSQYIHPFEMVAFFRSLGWIKGEREMLENRPLLPDGTPIAPVPPRLVFETRGTMYVPGLGRWILAPPSVADPQARAEDVHTQAYLPACLGGGMRPTELCNYFFWIRKQC